MSKLFRIIAFCILPIFLSAQVAQVEYGKNRVQYHRDFDQWLSYETQNFVTYWYGKSRNVGQKSAQIAESVYEDIVKTLEFRINDKIELVVYVDITDMKQSNIGSEEILSGVSGQTKIERNKIFVYFNGDHRDLAEQIRRGVGSVLLNYMLFGSEIQEIMQNIVALGLPPWFIHGLTSYIGTPWSIKADEELRDALSIRSYRNFEHFSRDYPNIAGHAFWYYVSLFHGKAEISNLIYIVRLNKNVENGVRTVLGIQYPELMENVWAFMKELNARELAGVQALNESKIVPFKIRRKARITNINVHPTEPLMAVVSNDIGKISIWLYDLQTGKRKRIFKKGYRNNIQETDYQYPHLAWNPKGNELAYIYEHRDKVYLEIFDLKTGKKERQLLPNRYQRVYSLDYYDDQNFILSASEQNFSDLFLYRTRTRQSRQLTSDIFDDRYAIPGYYNGEKGIYFSSNRNTTSITPNSGDTIIPLNTMNIYFLNPESKDTTIVRITNDLKADHTDLQMVDGQGLYYLNNRSGINNRMILTDPSKISEPNNLNLTTYPRNIQAFNIGIRNKQAMDVITYRGKSIIINKEVEKELNIESHNTTYYDRYLGLQTSHSDDSLTILSGFPREQSPMKPIRKQMLRESNPNYLFQTEYDDPIVEEQAPEFLQDFRLGRQEKDPGIKLPRQVYERVNPLRIVPYRLKFRIDFVNTTFDNNPLFGGLESYSGTGEMLYNNPMGLLFKANFKDLFEDYQIEGGIRVPTAFNGAEYFLLFDNKKRKIDRRFAFYRRANYKTEGAIANIILIRSKKEILLGMYEMRYPLDVYTSLRGAVTLRQDRFSFLASEMNTLNEPPVVDQRAGLRLEYIFDNTLPVELNLLNGTRYKFSVEMIKRFQIQFLDKARFDLGQGFMTVVGFDGRHYEPLGRHIVWATRIAGATSFGSENILYLLGGVDNPMFPRFNDNIPLPTEGSFAYQVLAPNVRGFNFNIRNGSSYALINTEIRIPVFQMVTKRPIRSNFIRHFQIVPFLDMGTAWQGRSPFEKDNPLNTLFIGDVNDPSTPIALKINYFRDPIVIGYGVGLRTMLFGYFMRIDYARGIETRVQGKPMFHFALGVDF